MLVSCRVLCRFSFDMERPVKVVPDWSRHFRWLWVHPWRPNRSSSGLVHLVAQRLARRTDVEGRILSMHVAADVLDPVADEWRTA